MLDTVVPLNSHHSFLSDAAPTRRDRPAPTGVFFYEYNVESLQSAVRYFEENETVFQPARLREHARRFRRELFKQRMKALIDETVELSDQPAPPSANAAREA